MLKKALLSVAAAAAFAGSAFSAELAGGEVAIGEPIEKNGMEIAAVYLAPIEMEPRGIDLAASKADIHLEADIHALKGNKNGFGEGDWMPYLRIAYKLENLSTKKVVKEGVFMPMVAQDGAHYGANIAIEKAGHKVGKYRVTYVIQNPEANGFGRHTDKATGVGKWFEPFSVSFDFDYKGTPK